MRFLENFVSTPIAGAIGWTLLHSLWEGAIVSAVLAAVLVAVRSPRVRYAAACAAMLVMLAGFGLTLLWLLPEQASGRRNVEAPVLYLAGLPPVSGAPDRWAPSVAAIAPWLGPFWIAGVCLFCLWYLASWASVQRMRRRGVCCAADPWQRELARLSAQLRVSRPVLLLESCFAAVPVVLGHFRPVILLPIGLLAGLPPAQMEAVLVHELAHIRRHDYLMNLLQRFAEGLLFYHPAVWWFSGVMRNEQEKCCDDVVVSFTGQAHEYALALVALEQSRFRGRQTAIAVTGGNLMKRIHRLLYPKPSGAAWSTLLAVAVFFATACASVAAWQSEPSKQSPTASQSQTGLSSISSDSKWLNEDVVYIIDDAERAAFQKLATDQERDHFIEQFWERRNPTPGSSENKFKEQHYHRLAYANQYFRTASGTPGWQTDRGHMLILYGPPDEIDSHPKGPERPIAVEIWTYRHIEGLGDNKFITFIDRTGRGDFRLAPGNAH
ncbi:MAG TPA: GWxTD domain-containing protein [Candidatus Acidoferrum sp.]|jgi:GWxTD domain-containing protein|nr:GWxTD domain-containing protein [Candidatus Acidoferrum sp.]